MISSIQVAAKKVPPTIVLQFSRQLLGISKPYLRTYVVILCAQNSLVNCAECSFSI